MDYCYFFLLFFAFIPGFKVLHHVIVLSSRRGQHLTSLVIVVVFSSFGNGFTWVIAYVLMNWVRCCVAFWVFFWRMKADISVDLSFRHERALEEQPSEVPASFRFQFFLLFVIEGIVCHCREFAIIHLYFVKVSRWVLLLPHFLPEQRVLYCDSNMF